MFKSHHPMTENESRELVLDSYVTYTHSHHCAICGAVEMFSQCFEVWLHPTKTRNSNLRDLRPVVGAHLKPLGMAQISVPAKMIPICHLCVHRYQVEGQPDTATMHISNEAWQETLRRKYAPAPAEPKVAKTSAATPKVIPTLDQI